MKVATGPTVTIKSSVCRPSMGEIDALRGETSRGVWIQLASVADLMLRWFLLDFAT
jgi:hypothetical protein